jgi:hypothetical protein
VRHAIETAPRDGKVVILEDDARETWGIASWSLEAGEWVGRDGKPSKITPTHWLPMPRDNGSSTLSQVGPSARRRRFNYFVAATAAALIGLLFYATLDTRQPGISRTRTIEPVVARGNQLPSQNSKIALPSHPTEASHADAFEEVAAAPEAEQSLKRERAQALTQELTEELEAQLRAEAAKNAQLLEQERQKTAALAQEVASARQELTTSAEKLHQALDEERERRAALADLQQSLQREQKKTAALMQEAKASQAMTMAAEPQRRALDEAQAHAAALASELAGTRREIETQAAQSQKAVDKAVQQKQAAEATIAELQQSLQQERQRAETLSSDLGEVRREVEALATLSRQKNDEAAQLKRVAETAKAELQQSLQQQQEKARALEGELEKVRQSADAQVATPRKTNEEAARTKHIETVTSDVVGTLRRQNSDETASDQAAEYAKAELRSLPQKRGQPKGITPNAETTRQSAGTGATAQPVSTEAKGSEAAGLLARAKALVGQGKIRAARDVLERAAETGSAQATFALAETYDPIVLATWRTRGTVGDVTKARDLYAMAYEGGIKAAKDRSHALVIAGGERKPASWFGREEADH